MRGRKPVPSHLKVVSGNPGRRPINKSEPKPVRSRPAAPSHMSGKAQETWGYVSAILDRMGVLTEADAIALEMLCEAYADHLSARATLSERGSHYYETTNQSGDVMHRAHPAVAVMQDADKRIKAWLAEFGKTPSSRSRLKADGLRDEDPADKFFA